MWASCGLLRRRVRPLTLRCVHVASGDEGVRGHVASEGVIVPGGGHMGNDGHGATGTCGRRGTLVAGTCWALGAEYYRAPIPHAGIQGPEMQLAPRRGTESACFN